MFYIVLIDRRMYKIFVYIIYIGLILRGKEDSLRLCWFRVILESRCLYLCLIINYKLKK